VINIDRLLAQVMNDAAPGVRHTGNPLGGDEMGAPGRNAANAPPQWPAAKPVLGGGLMNQAGAFGAGALAGGLAGMLFRSKSVRKLAGTALQVGAVAAIGGLAYQAYQNYREGKPVVPQGIRDMLGGTPGSMPGGSAQGPDIAGFIPPPSQSDAVGCLLLKSMIAASAADGHLDEAEHRRIRGQLQAGGFTEEEQKLLDALISQPASIAELVAEAKTPALRAEVYTAARLAIEPDSPEERDWLNRLAMALGLEPGLKAHLDAVGRDPKAEAA
jgi:uncharacterized membrane protein YebE (DUF533 family)